MKIRFINIFCDTLEGFYAVKPIILFFNKKSFKIKIYTSSKYHSIIENYLECNDIEYIDFLKNTQSGPVFFLY